MFIKNMLIKLTIFLLVLQVSTSFALDGSRTLDRTIEHTLSVQDYQEKVYASLLGQLVGNFYGLGYEFKFIDEPGPEEMPYGYSESILKRLAEADGAFSDDDTDIEYMYLLQMEKHGIEPNYRQLAEAWKYHVRERVWVANRVALTLMHTGLYPPHTGMKKYNSQWFQIDPQLVNEIWATTAPGMIEYAAKKSDWAARITSDDFGVEPTVHYAAMYAAAFFENDVEQLVEIGLQSLPAGSRFAEAIELVKQLMKQHPNDWQSARKALADRYYGDFDYNRGAWAAVDANLNGACGIMALLYGEGDFQKTLDMCCALGFDADNQAATMCGLLGLANGAKSIPRELLFPVATANWSSPFNDQYVNVSRHDLPDIRITDFSKRMARQGELVLLSQGGKREILEGVAHYSIPTNAQFVPPFELNPPPVVRGGMGESFEFEFYSGRPGNDVEWTLDGKLPDGLSFANGILAGQFERIGEGQFDIHAKYGGEVRTAQVRFHVRGKNLALDANQILFNPDCKDQDLSMLRDGDRRNKTYFSVSGHAKPKIDYYGYAWETPRPISAVRFSVGQRQEWGGWFTSLSVEFQSASGEWTRVSGLEIDPKPNLDNSQWLKASRIDYDLSFDPVETKAIRIIGSAGGIAKDAANQHLGTRYFTAISELSVYQK